MFSYLETVNVTLGYQTKRRHGNAQLASKLLSDLDRSVSRRYVGRERERETNVWYLCPFNWVADAT